MQTLAVICERDCYPTDNDNKEKSKTILTVAKTLV